MILLIGAFLAGMLTVLAPCILPLLPIIIGGSIAGDAKDKKRPIYIAVSLAISLLLFTLLLKATTVLVDIPPQSIAYFSGSIIILLGVFTLLPSLYARILAKSGLEARSLRFLGKGQNKKNLALGAIITGAALGPVFSSCSPMYGYILATILPANFSLAIVYMFVYIMGLALVLLLIGYFGQRFISKISWMSNPKGVFQRFLAVIFILVGIFVFTGIDKDFQTFVSKNTPFNIDSISSKLIPESNREYREGELLNVSPYKAPEFVGLQEWVNSEPKKLSDLRGKVVLVDFWTYSCINCIRNNPYIEGWYQQYKDDGLEVVGIHAPEFSFERNLENVKNAVSNQKINYSVALDNDFATWAAFQNQFWPTLYLIDANGDVRRVHSGEGEYRETEQTIRMLLMENGASLSDDKLTADKNAQAPVSDRETAETYLGRKLASNYGGIQPLGSNPKNGFDFPDELMSNFWALEGRWKVEADSISALGSAKLRFKINSKEAYIIAKSEKQTKVKVLLNGKPISETGNGGEDIKNSILNVQNPQLYKVVKFNQFESDSLLELQVEEGVQLNVFTFGS